jgi:predicted flap endonuclease-1-like 5' DNA nuclease
MPRSTATVNEAFRRSGDPPRVETPVAAAPKLEGPAMAAPSAPPPRAEAPRIELPKAAAPVAQAPRVEPPRVELPKLELPKVAAPTVEAPRVEMPKPAASTTATPPAVARAEGPSAYLNTGARTPGPEGVKAKADETAQSARAAAGTAAASVTAAAAAAAAAAIAQGRARETAAGTTIAREKEAAPAAPQPTVLKPVPAPVVELPAAGASSGVSGVAARVQVPPAQPAPAAPQASTALPASDDLKRIRGIGPDAEGALNKIGVRRYEQIAGWSAGDVESISRTLGIKGRIEHENWIEQAQVLAKGGETAFSRRYDRGDLQTVPTPKPAAPVQVTAPAPQPTVVQPSATTSTPTVEPARPAEPASSGVAAAAAAAAVSERARASAAPAGQAPAASATPTVRVPAPSAPMPTAPAGDDLTRIRGVDREIEKLLSVRGITRFGQIARWTPADAERFGSALALKSGRIQQEGWIEQARVLAGAPSAEAAASAGAGAASGDGSRAVGAGADGVTSWHQRRPGGDWDPSRAPPASAMPEAAGARPATNLAGMPSVRSEALTREGANGAGAAAATAAASGTGASRVRSGVPDDLKRIKGIGVVLEKKLHGLGVINYEQIAGWSQADIDKMSEVLDFKGRIERENWIEQARILASGGITDFARRVDRGEVETSKPKPVR